MSRSRFADGPGRSAPWTRPNVDTVTVRVDGGPPVDAALTPVKDKKLALVTFTATVVVAGGDDPHTVTVTAISDIMQSVHVTRLVFAGPSFTPTPPAVVADLRPSPFAKDSPELARIEAALQLNLQVMNALLGGGNEVVIGPHLLVTEDQQGRSLLRLGLWIEPSTFSAQPPAPPAFPLPASFRPRSNRASPSHHHRTLLRRSCPHRHSRCRYR